MNFPALNLLMSKTAIVTDNKGLIIIAVNNDKTEWITLKSIITELNAVSINTLIIFTIGDDILVIIAIRDYGMVKIAIADGKMVMQLFDRLVIIAIDNDGMVIFAIGD